MSVKFIVKSAGVLVVLFISLNCVFGYMREKPDYIPTCHKKDKNFVNCSTHSVQSLFDHVKDGIEEIHLAPTDPLFIDRIGILQGDGPVSVNASLRNVTVHGFGTTRVLYNSVHPKNYDFLTKMFLPLMRIEGNYELIGRILVLPLHGRGYCWFEATNLTMILNSDVDLYQRDGFSFYNVTGAHVDFDIGGLKLYMGNLFDGLKALEKTTNDFLNKNWRPAAESLRPVLAETIEEIILSILRQIFDNIPADFFVADIAEPVD